MLHQYGACRVDNDTPYEQVTSGIRIRVSPEYSDDQSTPEEGYFFWTYTIEIANESDASVQLKSRAIDESCLPCSHRMGCRWSVSSALGGVVPC